MNLFTQKKSGWYYLIQGLVTTVLGVIFLMNSSISLIAITRIIGILLLAGGAFILFGAMYKRDAEQKLMVFQGIVNIGIGLVFTLFPAVLTGVVIVIIGLFTFLSGLFNLLTYRKLYDKMTPTLLIRNILLILLGLFLLFNPMKGQEAVAVIIGVFALVFGIISLYQAYWLFFRKKTTNIE
ncbi:MAG: DUF308 domain-containing protein [Bacteroidales bacterium]|nr:DUF308 domain-containing protein [Bacteroidales bacterium]